MMLIGIIVLMLILYLIWLETPEDHRHQITNKDVKCYNCNHEIREDFVYCPQCRIALKEKCKNCNKYINADWRSCPYCNNQRIE